MRGEGYGQGMVQVWEGRRRGMRALGVSHMPVGCSCAGSGGSVIWRGCRMVRVSKGGESTRDVVFFLF